MANMVHFEHLWGDETPTAFTRPGAHPHYVPDRPGQVAHIRLDLDLDLEQQILSGTCGITLIPIQSGVQILTLDAVHLQIYSVQVDQEGHPFSHDGKRLQIMLSTPLQRGMQIQIEIHYAAIQPQRGIYFIHPTREYPDKPIQVWTQGEDEDSRFWFPCFDYPGQLATSEILVIVPSGFQALSNGKLIARESLEGGDQIRYHWHQSAPHPSYLMTLAVGRFAEVVDHWHEIPVCYYVEQGREADAKRTMGKTPEMISFFSTKFGYAYPYPKYGQVCVADFIFGGMENTSTTLLTDRCLLDERAALDHLRSESLVAHELAHQWFGDLVVIKHWSQAWVKEGMATYAEVLWQEFAYGHEQGEYHQFKHQESYLSEAQERYRRPMVTHVYQEPIELYDAHIYEKGACVYHMLRHELGEENFEAVLRTFLTDHAHSTVETIDLLRTIDKVTGRNLTPLFDQFVFRGGHPEFKVTYSWDQENQIAKLTINQTQDKEYLFDLRLPIGFAYDQGQRIKTFKIQIKAAEQSFYFPLETQPEFICFDQGEYTLKTVKLSYPLPELKAQLLHGPQVITRIHAARAIADLGELEGVKVLAEALSQESFWGVRVEICGALGQMKLDQAFQVLQSILKDPDPHVRKAAIQGLVHRKTIGSLDAILPLVTNGDPSYAVEAAAAQALGQIAGSGLELKPRQEQVIDALQQVLETRSGWNEVVRSGAVQGIAQFKTSQRALDLLLDQTRLGVAQPLRLSAIKALGLYGSEQEQGQILDRLQELSRETFFFTELAVIGALGQMKSPRAISILQSMESLDGRVGRQIYEAITKIQKRLGSDQTVKELRDELDQVKQTNQELLSRLAALEAKTERSEDP